MTGLFSALFPVFPSYHRRRLYQFIHGWLDDDMNLQQAFVETAEMFAVTAQSGDLRRSRACREMAAAIAQNQFESTAICYLPKDEIALLQTGKELGFALPASQLETLCDMTEHLKRGALGNIIAPVGLFLAMAGMLVAASTLIDLFNLPDAHLPSLARFYRSAGNAIASHVVLLIVSGFGVFGAIVWALPNYHGFARTFLDRFMPFSLYRTQAGATFLHWLMLLARASRHLDRSWGHLFAANASPYLRDRVGRIVRGIGTRTPAEAMAWAGTGFPDPEFIALLIAIERRTRNDNRAQAALIETSLKRWLERRKDSITRSMIGFRLFTMLVVATFLGSFFIIFYQIFTSGDFLNRGF